MILSDRVVKPPITDAEKLEYALGRFEKIYPKNPALAEMWLVESQMLEARIIENSKNNS